MYFSGCSMAVVTKGKEGKHKMNQRQLEIFTTLAENLNFTKTAEQLYLSQTTVTLQIHNLEEELGVKLFERTSRSVKLTYAGEVFLNGAKEILATIQKTVDATAYAGQGYTGKITIGFADDVNATGAANMVRTFSEKHPEILFHVSGGYPPDQEPCASLHRDGRGEFPERTGRADRGRYRTEIQRRERLPSEGDLQCLYRRRPGGL